METPFLTSTQRYAAAALFALALHQSQTDQNRISNPLVPLKDEPISEGVSVSASVSHSDAHQLWIDENSGLLLPIFSFLEVDDQARNGIKETAGVSSQVRHHVGAFLKLLSEESDGTSSERISKELALTKAVDSMVLTMESSIPSFEDSRGNNEYEIKCHETYPNVKTESVCNGAMESCETQQGTNPKMSTEEKVPSEPGSSISKQLMEEETLLTYQRKVTVLYKLLSACVAENTHVNKNCSRKKGYDARHRVTLRLLATWLNVKWIKMEAMETLVACSLVASEQEQVEKKDETRKSEGSWTIWNRGGVIGAAAVTGGTLMAVSGGLAAPAIAHGLSALAPSLGSLVPAVGASGFAAAASATGSAAGSVAVAASFGAAGAGLTGCKMARRIGSIDEFEFKVIGEEKQGRLAVGIMISGLVFEQEDFIKPWKHHKDNLERYALQWESNHLIAVSTAIQDWLTSKIAMTLMKEGAMQTVISSLLTAFSMPATLLQASDLIDSKWAIAVDRSDKVGNQLAEVLLEGLQGNRPVTLVGFSLEARVIFKCLQCLAETGDNAGFVEKVVLLGAPISIKDEKWEDARKMVAGRFVNVYSTNDWVLGIAFRASLLSEGLSGIQPIDIPGIENVDVTELIEGHSSYLWITNQILKQLDLESYYPVYSTTHAKPQEQKNSTTEFSSVQ
ncbi:Transmembrane and coiled-coil domain-containing protein 4-like [Melia azedarach]|uniref:Transmembrane and coiled-coil domain-containing protein 4-like n=1 Tax=Melia azedarach TaxID=155640 RepID=A0ACC1WS92_MELAZ|nr:Transmembrane and coiled-coil domain-containing protein 4-like [Melia azedarach]